MSYSREQFLIDVQNLLDSEEEKQYEKFLCIVEKYQNINQFQLKSIRKFDEIHTNLLNMLLPNNQDKDPLIDHSQYQQFDLIMKSLRQIVEKLVIDNCIAIEKIEQLDMKVNSLTEQTNHLQIFIYEKEFKKLLCSISTPLKNKLCQEFRRKDIRMDPLDEDVLHALHDGTDITGISNRKMETIRCIFNGIANEIGLRNKQVVEIMLLRLERNVEEHEVLGPYIEKCHKSRMKGDFTDLINYLNLNGLFKYKEKEIKTLKKIFDHYIDEYH
jgi:hypothetical protein